jgi:hypothetical protein
VLPIGKLENLRIEGDKLIGTPVFDENDKFALKIKSKYEAEIIKMASIGFDVVETSEDPLLVVSGQRRATVTKAKLIEVSLTDIGANDDALVLYKNGNIINLSVGENDDIVPMLVNKFSKQNNEIKKRMKLVALKLGLLETATETEILYKITELQNKAGRTDQMQKQMDEQLNKAIEGVVDAAIANKKITADKKSHFVGIGKTSGLEVLRETLGLIESAKRPSEVIDTTSGTGTTAYKKLSEVPEQELREMRKNDIETYRKLFKAEYGYEAKIEE